MAGSPESRGKELKPIFHCNAKLLVLGPRIGLDHNTTILYWEYQLIGI